MTRTELLYALGGVKDRYILDAQNMRSKKAASRRIGWKRAVVMLAAVVVLLALFCGTVMAVSPDFREYVIGILFPPKNEAIIIEGFEEELSYSSYGQVPEGTEPGFAIYVDDSRFTMTEENGVYYIRSIDWENNQNSNLPVQELVIEHSELDRETLSNQLRTQMLETWESVTEIELNQHHDCLIFHAANGMNWDSPREEHYFYSDGGTGSYHLTARYFFEAAEGTGQRFTTMALDFAVVTEEEVASSEAEYSAQTEG